MVVLTPIVSQIPLTSTPCPQLSEGIVRVQIIRQRIRRGGYPYRPRPHALLASQRIVFVPDDAGRRGLSSHLPLGIVRAGPLVGLVDRGGSTAIGTADVLMLRDDDSSTSVISMEHSLPSDIRGQVAVGGSVQSASVHFEFLES